MPCKFEAHSEIDNIWYLDNEASNHMIGNQSYFTRIDEKIMGKVRFDDDSRIDIKVKRSIIFTTKEGKRKALADVYFIPNLKSNMIK